MKFTRSNNIIFYMLIMGSGLALTLSLPIYNNKKGPNIQTARLAETRLRRQVVQPKWLNFGKEPDVDPTVYVNPEALFETEELRKTIQKAVQENTYAVTDDEVQDQNKDMEESVFIMPSNAETNTTHRPSNLSNLYLRLQKFWYDWSQSLRKMFLFN